MNNILVALLATVFVVPTHVAEIQEYSGSLIYLSDDDKTCSWPIYRTERGEYLQIFDKGLCFNPNTEDLSPDKSYAAINFSVPGMLENGNGHQVLHSKYFCAFVRMSNGCVVRVNEGEICGGEWSGASEWSFADTRINDLERTIPKVGDIYRSYASGHKDHSQVSHPRILAYLAEGTTFDNLLICDPPSDANRVIYFDLLARLQRDEDTQNASKLQSALNKSDTKPAARTGSTEAPAQVIQLKP